MNIIGDKYTNFFGIIQTISIFFCIFAPKSNTRKKKKPYDESIPSRPQTVPAV
jgi:hypothetical protein